MKDVDSLKKILAHPYTVLTITIMTVVFLYFYLFYESPENVIKSANESYFKAEQTMEATKRETYFNEALSKFLQLEKEFDPSSGNGKLYFAIGNSFFQLGEYPYAILYYYKSLYLNPLDNNTKENLKTTLAKLNLTYDEKPSFLHTIFFFHYLVSVALKLQLFFVFFMFFIVTASCYIWLSVPFFRNISVVILTLAIITFLSLTFNYIFQHSEAVIVKSTNLYKGSGKQFATVTENPLPAGSKVWILSSDPEGNYIKIENKKGQIGFIESSSIKLIF